MVNDQVLRDIERFIEDHQMFMVLESSVHKEEVEYNLTSFLEKHRRPNFQQVLFQYIDDRNGLEQGSRHVGCIFDARYNIE